jgi:hypothetical protein
LNPRTLSIPDRLMILLPLPYFTFCSFSNVCSIPCSADNRTTGEEMRIDS